MNNGKSSKVKKTTAKKSTRKSAAKNSPPIATASSQQSISASEPPVIAIGSYYQPIIKRVNDEDNKIVDKPLSVIEGDEKRGDDTVNMTKGEDKPPETLQPAQIPFLIALIKSKGKNGFWRAKRFWPCENKQVLVLVSLDDLVALNAQLSDEGDFDETITLAEYELLDAEPRIINTITVQG